jgi:hypothetical protein
LHAELERAQLRSRGVDIRELLTQPIHQGFGRDIGFGPQPFFY